MTDKIIKQLYKLLEEEFYFAFSDWYNKDDYKYKFKEVEENYAEVEIFIPKWHDEEKSYMLRFRIYEDKYEINCYEDEYQPVTEAKLWQQLFFDYVDDN